MVVLGLYPFRLWSQCMAILCSSECHSTENSANLLVSTAYNLSHPFNPKPNLLGISSATIYLKYPYPHRHVIIVVTPVSKKHKNNSCQSWSDFLHVSHSVIIVP